MAAPIRLAARNLGTGWTWLPAKPPKNAEALLADYNAASAVRYSEQLQQARAELRWLESVHRHRADLLQILRQLRAEKRLRPREERRIFGEG